MLKTAIYGCDLCEKTVTPGDGHRIMIVSGGGKRQVRSADDAIDDATNVSRILLCPLDDDSAKKFAICNACRDMLCKAQEKSK